MGKPVAPSFLKSPLETKLRRSVLSSLLALAFSSSATAAWAYSNDAMELLTHESQVFAASRYVQLIEETPANVTVLSREEIKRFGYRNLHQALTSLPGIYNAASQWPALGVRGIAVPGDFGSRILYLVNGMPIYEATYGGFFVDYLDIESIDRIEVVKGAGSALYGSGAVHAVVNLITRTGNEAAGATVSLEAASHRTGKLYGSLGQSLGQRTESFVSASILDSAGRNIYLREFDDPQYGSQYGGVSRGNDDARTLRLFGRIANQGAWAQGLFISERKNDPLASYNTVFNGDLLLREALGAVEAGMNHELANGDAITARTYYFKVAEKGNYPYSRSEAPDNRGMQADYINVSDLSSQQLGFEVRYDKFFSHDHHLLAGLEYKRVSSHQKVGDQPGLSRAGVVTVNTRPHYAATSLFVQDELRFGAGRLFLGARFDSYDGFSEGVSSRLSPRIAYVHEFSRQTTGKLIYGEAYRVPTLYESHYQDGLPAAETIWANPALRPELARSFEALLEHQATRSLKWKIAAFLNRLSDTPVQVVTPVLNGVPCMLGPESCIQYRNSEATQRVVGVEGDVQFKLSGQEHLYALLVLQNSRINGEELPASPKYQVKLGFSRTLPWHNMTAAVEANYTGATRGRFLEGGNRTASTPAYLLLNGTLNADQVAGGWHLSLRATNLLDSTIYTVASSELQPLERVPAPGRRFSLQLQRDF